MTAPKLHRSHAAALFLAAWVAGCGSPQGLKATSLVSDDLTALVEDRPGKGNLVRVQTSPAGAVEEGPMLLTVQPFDDADGDLQLDEGEAVGESFRVGNGKTASLRLQTADFDLPQTSSGPAMLSIRIDSRGGRTDWTVWRDPETGFWKRRHASRSGLQSRF